jgi:hypothetical protein
MYSFNVHQKITSNARFTLFILLLLTQFFFSCTREKNIKVYVTKTGKSYHTKECFYLAKSKIPIEFKDALRDGYTPCKKCRATTIEQHQNQ